jgi:hypothetical protein
VKAGTEERKGAGNVLQQLKVDHEPVVFPGWLIQLDDAKVNPYLCLSSIIIGHNHE